MCIALLDTSRPAHTSPSCFILDQAASALGHERRFFTCATEFLAFCTNEKPTLAIINGGVGSEPSVGQDLDPYGIEEVAVTLAATGLTVLVMVGEQTPIPEALQPPPGHFPTRRQRHPLVWIPPHTADDLRLVLTGEVQQAA